MIERLTYWWQRWLDWRERRTGEGDGFYARLKRLEVKR